MRDKQLELGENYDRLKKIEEGLEEGEIPIQDLWQSYLREWTEKTAEEVLEFLADLLSKHRGIFWKGSAWGLKKIVPIYNWASWYEDMVPATAPASLADDPGPYWAQGLSSDQLRRELNDGLRAKGVREDLRQEQLGTFDVIGSLADRSKQRPAAESGQPWDLGRWADHPSIDALPDKVPPSGEHPTATTKPGPNPIL